ncbi:hypothetical protein KR067_000501, partial [Drosophila pandora]
LLFCRFVADVDVDELFVYQYPLLPPPLIKYDFIYQLACTRSQEVSLPLVVEVEPSTKPSRLSIPDRAKKPPTRLTYHTPYSASSTETEVEPEPEEEKYRWNSPRLMILCEDGDINCALYYLLESLHDPFAANSVAVLFLQESLLSEFIDRLKDRLEPLNHLIASHPAFIRTLERLKEVQAKVIVGNPETVPENASPRFVFDLNQRFLSDGPTGVITLHTFRTMKEAISLMATEQVPFTSVSIWNEKLGAAYELVARMKPQIFLLNCFYVNLDPIGLAFACSVNSCKITDGYHYESLTFKEKRKVVVHPIGTIWGKQDGIRNY